MDPSGVLEPVSREAHDLALAREVRHPDLAEVELGELGRQSLEPNHDPGGGRSPERLHQLVDGALPAFVAPHLQPVQDLDRGQLRLLLQDPLHSLSELADLTRTSHLPSSDDAHLVQTLDPGLLGDTGHRPLRHPCLLRHLPVREPCIQQDLHLVSLDHWNHLHPPPVGEQSPQEVPDRFHVNLGDPWCQIFRKRGVQIFRNSQYSRSTGEDRMKQRTRDERGTRFVEDLVQDLAYGVRSLRRSPGFTLTAVLTLALGIGAGTAVFSLVDGALLRPLPYGEPDRLVELRELGEDRRFFPSFPNFPDWRARSSSFEAMVAVQPMGALPVLRVGDPFRASTVLVSRDLLATAGLRPFLSRDLLPEEHLPGGPDVVLVSHRLSSIRLGADPELDHIHFEMFGQPYRVVGVLPPGFELMYEADLYLSAERWPGTVRTAHAYRVVGRVQPACSANSPSVGFLQTQVLLGAAVGRYVM